MDIDKAIILSRELLHVFGEEILGERARKELSNSKLTEIFSFLDPAEEWFHIEGRFLWNKNEWKRSQELEEKRKAIHAKERQIILDRRDYYDRLKFEIEDQWGLDEKGAHILALGVIKNVNIKVAAALGIDLTGLPTSPYLVTVIDKKFGNFTI